jgi:hypothetical protein
VSFVFWDEAIRRQFLTHPSPTSTDLPGGGSHLAMRLSCLEEIEQWVLSWSTRATVVKPQALAERVATVAGC